jgi:stress response protein SCP2
LSSNTPDFVISEGDNQTGEGNGDDETIDFKLANAPADAEHLFVAV